MIVAFPVKDIACSCIHSSGFELPVLFSKRKSGLSFFLKKETTFVVMAHRSRAFERDESTKNSQFSFHQLGREAFMKTREVLLHCHQPQAPEGRLACANALRF